MNIAVRNLLKLAEARLRWNRLYKWSQLQEEGASRAGRAPDMHDPIRTMADEQARQCVAGLVRDQVAITPRRLTTLASMSASSCRAILAQGSFHQRLLVARCSEERFQAMFLAAFQKAGRPALAPITSTSQSVDTQQLVQQLAQLRVQLHYLVPGGSEQELSYTRAFAASVCQELTHFAQETQQEVCDGDPR